MNKKQMITILVTGVVVLAFSDQLRKLPVVKMIPSL